ncbi:MAG: hypothetical protein JST26_15205 [Bacteroidetes bacterium]|nr:hypothetical protein [Bacteroidota bacterium]
MSEAGYTDHKKHILLIAYVFPPYYGIGGRRWAKHAIALTRLGYTIHVICAENPFPKKSLWWDTVKCNPSIILYQLPARYPGVLLRSAHTFSQKIRYKFWDTLIRLFTKGTPYDRTAFWKNSMLRAAKKIIATHDINQVICTGGPFGVMYHATLLKAWKPDLFILNDLRDPWTWGPNWGFPALNPKRMAEEKKMECAAIRDSDVFTVPNEVMYNYLISHYPQFKNKIRTIPHFFDPSEIPVKPKTPSPIIRLVLYGTIYEGIGHYLEQSAVFFAAHQNTFSLDIYTDNQQHAALFQKYGAHNVKFHNQLPAVDLFNRFDQYDFVLLYTPEYGKDNISTKFFEIIHSRTPVIFFSSKGKASDFMEVNHLGIHVDSSTFEEKLLSLANGTTSFRYNNAYDISDFSIEKIAENISHLLENPLAL